MIRIENEKATPNFNGRNGVTDGDDALDVDVEGEDDADCSDD